jgi:hypothetical protein
MFMLSAPQLGNPTIENEEQVKVVSEFLKSEGHAVDVQGAIVFVAQNIEVEINESPVPIVHVTELLDYVRDSLGGEVAISGRDRELIVEKLSRGEELERSAGTPVRPKKRVRAA